MNAKDSTAQLLGTCEYSVRQTRTAPNTACPISGKPIDQGKPWSLFKLFDAIDSSAETDAPEALLLAVADLNKRGISDFDDPQVGITQPKWFKNTQCVMEPGAPVVSARDIDSAIGLRRGERCHGVSLAYLHRAAPTIERYLSERFGTPLYEPPAAPQPSAEEIALTERNATKLAIATLAARALFVKQVPTAAEVSRIIQLFEAAREYWAV